MLHPDTKLQHINSKKGYGIIATRYIPKGTVTWVRDELDQVISPQRYHELGADYQELLETYSYRDRKGDYILCWDLARYINHSSISNCLTTAYEFEIAVRDIYPGEELTDDYGYLNIREPFFCQKEAGTDREVIYPDDLLRFYRQWDHQLLDAFQYFEYVHQPLLQVFPTELLEVAQKISRREVEMDSIVNCYYTDLKMDS